MKISSDNLIAPSVIRDMLKHLPVNDLKGISEIKVMLRPPIKQQRTYGYGDYHFPKQEIRIFLWSIKESIVRGITSDNNYYHAFLKQIASTLYHEVGHHVDYRYGDLKKQSRKEERLHKKREKAKQDHQKYSSLSHEIYEINSKIENFAIDYSRKYIPKYHPKLPSFRKIRFIKIYREKLVDCMMNSLRESSHFSYHQMAIVEHLRKCKLSKYALYSITELCEKLNNYFYSNRKLVQKYRRKVKTICLKLEEPLFYISKRNRKYAYYTQKQVNILLKNLELQQLMIEYNKIAEKMNKVERLEFELKIAKKDLIEIS